MLVQLILLSIPQVSHNIYSCATIVRQDWQIFVGDVKHSLKNFCQYLFLDFIGLDCSGKSWEKVAPHVLRSSNHSSDLRSRKETNSTRIMDILAFAFFAELFRSIMISFSKAFVRYNSVRSTVYRDDTLLRTGRSLLRSILCRYDSCRCFQCRRYYCRLHPR